MWRSRCIRFLAVLGSGTLWMSTRGPSSARIDHRGVLVAVLGWDVHLVGEGLPRVEAPPGGGLHHVSQGGGPELGEGERVVGVDRDLKGACHGRSLRNLILTVFLEPLPNAAASKRGNEIDAGWKADVMGLVHDLMGPRAKETTGALPADVVTVR